MRFRPQQVAGVHDPSPPDSAPSLNLGDQLLGRELRKAVAHDNLFGPEACGETQSGSAIRCELHLKSVFLEQVSKLQSQPGVVFDDQRQVGAVS